MTIVLVDKYLDELYDEGLVGKVRGRGLSKYILIEDGKEYAGKLLFKKKIGKLMKSNSVQEIRAILEEIKKLVEIALQVPENESLKVLSCISDIQIQAGKIATNQPY